MIYFMLISCLVYFLILVKVASVWSPALGGIGALFAAFTVTTFTMVTLVPLAIALLLVAGSYVKERFKGKKSKAKTKKGK